MIKYVQKLTAVMVLTLALALSVVAPVAAVDVISPDACPAGSTATLCVESTQAQQTTNNSIYGPHGILTKAISLLSYVVGFAAVIMIMVGGFKYITSAGDSNSVNSAKNTILYAVVGLIVAILARFIVAFVINRL